MRDALMSRVASARVTWTWGVLCALTGVSWALAATRTFTPSTALTITVLAIAAVKTRLVIRQFMDVRAAPHWLRRATDAWLVALMAAILVLYLSLTQGGYDHGMPHTDMGSRVMAAPPGRVWAALIDPEALLAWLPPGGMTGRFERFDARPGGSYRMVLTYRDASGAPGKASADSDIVEARFAGIVPGERVVQAVDFVSDDPAYAGTMTMTWEVTAVDAGTRVDIVAEDVPDGISADDHAAGLASSLAQLAAYVEQ